MLNNVAFSFDGVCISVCTDCLITICFAYCCVLLLSFDLSMDYGLLMLTEAKRWNKEATSKGADVHVAASSCKLMDLCLS